MNRLPDEQREIVEHMSSGARLIGPVAIDLGHGHRRSEPRSWGLVDRDNRIRRARQVSVEALIRRGIVRVRRNGDRREAHLTERK